MKNTLVTAAVVAFLSATADAALLQYTMTGTGAAGSVGGTAFTNGTVTVSWTYDTASSDGFDFFANSNLTYERLVVSPSFSISSAAGNWSGSLVLGLGVQQWQAISLGSPAASPTISQIIMNGANTSSSVVQFGLAASDASLRIGMRAPASVSGAFVASAGSFAASFGTVSFDDTVVGSGTFTIVEIPAPGAAALALGAGLVSRRRRR